MPETMTISKVGASRTFETQHGKFVSYRIELEGHGEAELVQKPETPVPSVGQSVFGDLVPGKEGFPPKLKKAQKSGGGGSWGPRQDDPGQRRSIERQVSAKIASDLVIAGVQPLEKFRDLTDRVHAAIEGQ